jgi:FkbM family methyltransferase
MGNLKQKLTASLEIIHNEGITEFLKKTKLYLFEESLLWRLRVRINLILRKQIEINGVSMKTSDKISTNIGGSLLKGNYEHSEYILLKEHLPREDDIIELGAGIGYISCIANKLKNPNSSQVVVEANKDIVPLLTANKTLNKCDFKTISSAYSPTKNKVQLKINKDFWSSSHIKDEVNQYEMEVDTTDLEEILSNEDIGRFTLICDIEGGEIELIKEVDLLEKKCQKIMIELHQLDDNSEHPDTYHVVETLENNNFHKLDKEGNVVVLENQSINES